MNRKSDWNPAAAPAAGFIHADAKSKKLFEELVADEERHYDQYDTEFDNLARFGKDYLALQIIERSKNRGMPGAE